MREDGRGNEFSLRAMGISAAVVIVLVSLATPGLAATDSNIDHRRVPNLMVFFSRKGESLPITIRPEDFAPGDLVTWDLGGGVPHIGILVDAQSPESGRHLIVHNIGYGPKMEDVLFRWRITGHFRYFDPVLR